jgi:hypothetical protein
VSSRPSATPRRKRLATTCVLRRKTTTHVLPHATTTSRASNRVALIRALPTARKSSDSKTAVGTHAGHRVATANNAHPWVGVMPVVSTPVARPVVMASKTNAALHRALTAVVQRHLASTPSVARRKALKAAAAQRPVLSSVAVPPSATHVAQHLERATPSSAQRTVAQPHRLKAVVQRASHHAVDAQDAPSAHAKTAGMHRPFFLAASRRSTAKGKRPATRHQALGRRDPQRQHRD